MIVFLEPPAQYDHPYPGQVVEQRLSRLQIIVTCHGPAESCSWLSKGVQDVVEQFSKDANRNARSESSYGSTSLLDGMYAATRSLTAASADFSRKAQIVLTGVYRRQYLHR